jgi:hypothetical protein
MATATFPHRHGPATPLGRPARTARTLRNARAARRETSPDHGLLIKIVAGVLLITATVAFIAPFGWGFMAAAFALQIAVTAGLIHVTVRMLNDPDEEG